MKQYSLVQVEKTEDETVEFVKKSLELVDYINYRTVDEEMKRVNKLSFITMFWIQRNNEIVGVVKVSIFNFYDLGLNGNIPEHDYIKIFSVIEERIKGIFTGRVHGNIDHKYYQYFEQKNWYIQYSRYRMELLIPNVKNQLMSPEAQDFDVDDLLKLEKVVWDAYEGGIDEEIGMISKTSVISSLTDIKNGHYGPFRPDLSTISRNRWGKISGISLITISEGCPFLVLIGVRKKAQHNGLGRKLLSKSIDKCAEQGYQCMKLWVTQGNPSFQFYTSLGFNVLSQISSIYKNTI